MKALLHATKGATGIVLADARFPNEASFVKSVGGVVLGVDRGIYRDPNTDYSHASEMHAPELLNQCDHVIPNLGTLEELHYNTVKAIECLGL